MNKKESKTFKSLTFVKAKIQWRSANWQQTEQNKAASGPQVSIKYMLTILKSHSAIKKDVNVDYYNIFFLQRMKNGILSSQVCPIRGNNPDLAPHPMGTCPTIPKN